MEEEYLRVIDSRKESPLQHIGGIWFSEREGVRLRTVDAQAFRSELYTFLHQLDQNWPAIDDHDDPQGVAIDDFTGYPTLARYAHSLLCWDQSWHAAYAGTGRRC